MIVFDYKDAANDCKDKYLMKPTYNVLKNTNKYNFQVYEPDGLSMVYSCDFVLTG
jgi:hypothetical protein